jgi:serine/threonine protein kinase
VLVSRDGEVKIVDFGIASTGGRADQGGSRGYMAPEQEKGARPDARSDLYAVGVLVWELATGRRWDGSPLESNHGLAEIVKRATEERPDKRYPDAANMLSQVSRFLRELSLGPTQLELSEYVRRQFPPVAAPREGRDDTPAKRTGPQTAAVPRPTGPQTALAPGRTGKQVTFATRIAPPGSTSPRRSLAIGALALLVAAASGGFFWWRSASSTVTPPVPPANTVAPNPNPNVPPAPNPAVKTGRLSLTTTPPGAEARLGDRLLGQTPLEADVPLDGPQALHLRKRGHQPLDISLPPALFTGTPPSAALSEKLIPLGKGELTLNALPWAHVTIDGEKRPDTPLLKYPLPAGPHQVRVACPATGRELKFTVVVEADKEVKRLADLRAEPKLLD